MWLLNIGNTHTQIAGVSADGRPARLRRLPTAELSAADFADVDAMMAACVVPAVRARLAGLPVRWVGVADATRAGVDFSRVDSSTLGADRIANAVTLAAEYRLPAVNFDFGTAITVELVDGDGFFCGGAIAPGRGLMRRMLTAGTAQLPELAFDAAVPECAGRNTLEALALGIDRGVIGLVRELLEVVRRQSKGELTVVASGGDAAFFLKAFPEFLPGGEDFTLRGVLKIALANDIL